MNSIDVTREEVFEYLTEAIKKHRETGYGTTDPLACTIMMELIKAGYADFLLLKDEEVQKWWSKVYSTSREKLIEYKTKQKDYELKVAGYERLNAQERRVLGIKKPSTPKLDYIVRA